MAEHEGSLQPHLGNMTSQCNEPTDQMLYMSRMGLFTGHHIMKATKQQVSHNLLQNDRDID